MKKVLLTLAVILPMLAGCGKEEVWNNPVESVDNPKEYTISLGFSGEITDITESPLNRADGGANTDLYGIQVYSSSSINSHDYKPYAYGLFDKKESMVIKLVEGRKYKFIATMVVDGKEKVKKTGDGYITPFMGLDVKLYGMPLNNGFTLSTNDDYKYMSLGNTYLQKPSKIFSRPNTERYYGEAEGYIPSSDGQVSINMKRVSFGAKFIAEGLSEGKLTIQMNESPDMEIVYPETEVQDIFTFENSYSNSLAWMANNYSETVPVIITWQKNDGASVPVASRNITFKRNKLTTINVKVTNSSVDNGIDITTDNEEMQAGDTIVIGASGSEDTGVDVN